MGEIAPIPYGMDIKLFNIFFVNMNMQISVYKVVKHKGECDGSGAKIYREEAEAQEHPGLP